MAGKSDALESAILKLILQAVAIANIADNAAASPLTNLFVSLHTADPTDSGNQSSNEATYTGYARVAVVRTSSGWSVSGTAPTAGSNVSAINFGACTAGSNTITHVGIGTSSSGVGSLLYAGALTSPLAVSAGITPSFAAGALTITED